MPSARPAAGPPLPAAARDPLMRPLDGRFLRQGPRAVVELATASGLSRVSAAERDARGRDHVRHGPDPGRGDRPRMPGDRAGPGWQRHDRWWLRPAGRPRCAVPRCPRGRPADGRWRAGSARARRPRRTVAAAGRGPPDHRLGCVQSAAAAPRARPRSYGPQKGLDAGDVARLDGNLARYADLLLAETGLDVRDVPGAGAAGGTTASLLAIAGRFASFAIRPGIDVVMELTDFDARLADSDLAISGEGRIDAQTAFGKTCLGVARAGGRGRRRLPLLWWRRDRGRRGGPAGCRCPLVPGHRGSDDRGGGDGRRCRSPGTRRGTSVAAMVGGGALKAVVWTRRLDRPGVIVTNEGSCAREIDTIRGFPPPIRPPRVPIDTGTRPGRERPRSTSGCFVTMTGQRSIDDPHRCGPTVSARRSPT